MRETTENSNPTVADGQLDLFAAMLSGSEADTGLERGIATDAEAELAPVTQSTSGLNCAPEPSQRLQHTGEQHVLPRNNVRVTVVEDMPPYDEAEHAMVESSLEALPDDRVWFTYSAVQRSFGISRATVARRMKEGVIPGIRFCGKTVLEDGAVRRFSRLQIHWLLLAVRRTRAEHRSASVANLGVRRPSAP